MTIALADLVFRNPEEPGIRQKKLNDLTSYVLAASLIVADGDKGDITLSGSGTAWTIDAGVVTLAKMADIATDRLVGRDTAGTGVPEALTVSGGIEFTGAGGIQSSAYTGDATKAAGGTALTLATVNGNVGAFGSATQAPQITFDGKGRATAVANVTITPAWGSVSGTPTTLSGYGITDAQPLDADLTTIAGLTATTDNFIVSVASAWASRTPAQVRTTLGLVIGTDVQAYHATLAALAAGTTTPLPGSGTVQTGGSMGLGTTSPDVFSRGETLTLGLTSSGSTSIGINAATGNAAMLYLGVNGTRTIQIVGDAAAPGITSGAGLDISLSPGFTTRVKITSSGIDVMSGNAYYLNAVKVLGAQGAAVTDPTGGAVVDVECRAQLAALLARVRAATGHGLIA